MPKLLSLMLLVPLLSACVLFEPQGPRQVTLLYSGNLDGELEPCGCSESGNLGGIKRRVNMVDKLRAENDSVFLVSAGGLLMSEMPQDKLKSEYILKGLAALDYDAVGVQWQDLAYGEDFLKKADLPFVASNWLGKGMSTGRLIERDGHKLAYFQWLDPATDPQSGMTGGTSKLASDQTGDMASSIAAAKAKGATTMLATTLPLEQAKALVPLEHLDVLLIESSYEVYGEPQRLGKTVVLQPGSRGMRLGRADLTVDAQGDVLGLQHEVIPLPPKVEDAPRMAGWYQEYNDKVREDYERRVALRKAKEQGESPYAGEQACQSCHQQEHATWFGTRHAEAFYALQDVNKAFDPDCIGCHTVGFEKPGGFIDPAMTSNLMHVQCESCHGEGAAHAKSGGQKPLGNAGWTKEQVCGQCHVHEHSPDFDIDAYWPKIAH